MQLLISFVTRLLAFAIPAWNKGASELQDVSALTALIQRRLPEEWHDKFRFTLEAHLPGFSINPGSKVHISAADISTLSRGLLTYLRAHGGDIYWSGDTFHLLDDDFSKDLPCEGASWAEWRYWLNVCTYSYTTVFYQWEEWECLLDWASLHGINLPLAVGGQEYIWAEVYRDLGLTDDQILPYFSGPAYQAWQRMGNIHGSWEMEVTREWLDKQWNLQLKIIDRMLALGMTPVLPAFSGFVPAALQEHIGGPQFLRASSWNNFSDEFTRDSAIDPTWKTWDTMQSAFLKKQYQLYGNWTSHYYSIDLYNELSPPSLDAEYLCNNTRSVVASLKKVDPEAVWVMQGWLFVNDGTWDAASIRAVLSGADKDDMIILDLTSEALPAWNETSNYHGKPWIWNALIDYGQTQGLYGSLAHYAAEAFRSKKDSPGLVGVGITMEGMNQNEIDFELVLDIPWSTTAIDPLLWVERFLRIRYGFNQVDLAAGEEHAQKAWRLLGTTVYNNTDFGIRGVTSTPLELVPSPNLSNRTGIGSTLLAYDPEALVEALDHLISAADTAPGLSEIDTFVYDLIDCTRQALMNAGLPIYRNTLGTRLVELLYDVDAVLAMDDHFLLSKWITQARGWSTNSTVQDFLEYQGRNQIVLWGTGTAVPWPLDRYAAKQWHGVVGDVYAECWDMYWRHLLVTPLEAYNQTSWEAQVISFEKTWEHQKLGRGRPFAKADVFKVVKRMRRKWDKYLQ